MSDCRTCHKKQQKSLALKRYNTLIFLLAKISETRSRTSAQTARNFDATSSWGFALHLFMRGEEILKMNVVFTSKKEIRDRIWTDIEFDVFQGALSHANAKHSCKLMRQASCDKIRRKPFAWREVCSFRVRSAKGIEFGVLIFLQTFWIKPKSGRIKKKRRIFCLFYCSYFLALPQKVTKKSSA